MLDFLFRNWDTAFGVSLNSVKNLLFTISIKNSMFSSISGWLQGIFECQFQRISWTNRMWSPAHWSKFESCISFLRYHEYEQSAGLRIRCFEQLHLVGRICKRILRFKIGRSVTRRFRVVQLALHPFTAALLPVKLDHRIASQFHQVFWSVSWLFHRQLWMEQNLISFRMVWYHHVSTIYMNERSGMNLVLSAFKHFHDRSWKSPTVWHWFRSGLIDFLNEFIDSRLARIKKTWSAIVQQSTVPNFVQIYLLFCAACTWSSKLV
jgi:hypothetical protein